VPVLVHPLMLAKAVRLRVNQLLRSPCPGGCSRSIEGVKVAKAVKVPVAEGVKVAKAVKVANQPPLETPTLTMTALG